MSGITYPDAVHDKQMEGTLKDQIPLCQRKEEIYDWNKYQKKFGTKRNEIN